MFLRLYLAKQVANGLVLARHSQLVEVTTLLEQLSLFEHLAKSCDEFKAVGLHETELNESRHSDLAFVVACFDKEVRTNSILSELIDDQAL